VAFQNSYEDTQRAEAYAQLEFARTYHLAYRDLPEIVGQHARGNTALDFGCGAGRSTRFLRALGLTVTGVDISSQMVAQARQLDPGGDYRVIASGDFSGLAPGAYDVILSAFTFDNIPAAEKPGLFRGLAALLQPAGCLVNLVSDP
jgi:trans-aconitate methyltransferase